MQDEEFLEEFLKEVRSYQPYLPPPSLLELVAYDERVFLNTRERGDHHANFRLSVLYALHKSFSLDDRPFIRYLLQQEILFHQGMWAFSSSIQLCGFLLFLLGEVEDVQLLWEAKTASIDAYAGFDIQLLVGAGVSTTLDYLQRAHEPWSERARKLIEQCQRGKDFDTLDAYRKKWHAEFHRRATLKRNLL